VQEGELLVDARRGGVEAPTFGEEPEEPAVCGDVATQGVSVWNRIWGQLQIMKQFLPIAQQALAS